MQTCNMIAYATKVGLNDMSSDDLKGLLIQLKMEEVENGISLQRYGLCVDIRRVLRDLIQRVSHLTKSKEIMAYDTWIKEEKDEEERQLKRELEYMNKLYAMFSSSGDIDMAEKTKECRDIIMEKLNDD